MSRSTQKLPPIFLCLSSAICNQPFIPLHFTGSRAANYHYSLTCARFLILRSTPGSQRDWHLVGVAFKPLGTEFVSRLFSRTLWIECARSLQLSDKSLFVSGCACPPIPALVHLHHSLYCLSLACFFFYPLNTAFSLSLQIGYMEQCST